MVVANQASAQGGTASVYLLVVKIRLSLININCVFQLYLHVNSPDINGL